MWTRLAWRDGHTVAFLDVTGGGIETIAQTCRLDPITLMWSAFESKPLIVRVHGTAAVVENGAEGWDTWVEHFPPHPGARAVVVVTAELISDSCGMGVPLMALEGDRDGLDRWADSKGPAGVRGYGVRKNAESLDGLPGLRLAADA